MTIGTPVDPIQPQPIPQPKKRSFVKIAGLGCLGLIALLVVLAIIGALANSGESGATPTPRPAVQAPTATTQAAAAVVATSQPTTKPDAPTPTLKPQPTPTTPTYAWGNNKEDVHVQLGENVTAEIPAPGSKGIHKVTILKISDGAKSSNQFENPGEGKKYWVLEVQLENAGTAELYGGTWKLRTSDDFELDPTFAVGFGDPFRALQSLTPGAKTKGTVVFAIPSGVTPKFLRYDPNTLVKGDLYFDAVSPTGS